MIKTIRLTPARITSFSFLILMIIGALLLWIPLATQSDTPSSFIDAFFTATSATCVTGLAVQDTVNFYSLYGQIVIMILIQVGGLGIMILAAMLPIIFGRQLQTSQRDFFDGMLDKSESSDLKRAIKSILKYSLVIESIGALILTLRWYVLWDDFPKALYYGIFHSISAFCNAGFALFSNNLESFQSDPVIYVTIMTLIVLGGLGFMVHQEIFSKKSFSSYNFHTKIVLSVSALLIVLPTFFVFFSEFANSLMGLEIMEKFQVSLFQIISTRTAGFTSVSLVQVGNASLFLICVLMFIGGSPGGTAGGVKTTTIAVLFFSIRALLKGRESVEIFNRRVTQEQSIKAFGVLAISFAIVTILTMTLMVFEPTQSFRSLFFETISAYGTVGLSLNLSPELNTYGKIIVSLTMFLGRIGPLTLVYVIGTQNRKLYYRYPEGRMMLG